MTFPFASVAEAGRSGFASCFARNFVVSSGSKLLWLAYAALLAGTFSQTFLSWTLDLSKPELRRKHVSCNAMWLCKVLCVCARATLFNAALDLSKAPLGQTNLAVPFAASCSLRLLVWLAHAVLRAFAFDAWRGQRRSFCLSSVKVAGGSCSLSAIQFKAGAG